jgi:hypothetical protein
MERGMIIGILIFIVVIVVLCLLVSAVDCNRFVTVTYRIKSNKLSRPCKAVLLSDLHNKSFGRDNEKLIEEIHRINPDFILVAGDMLTARKGKDFTPALSLMKKLSKEYKIYYGMGNHEYRLKLYPEQYKDMYEKYMAGLSEVGIEPLVNETAYLPEWNLAVTGTEIDRRYYRRLNGSAMEDSYLQEILGKPREDACRILIAHNPDFFEQYAAWGADVVVSGHVHGGIMRLPLFGGVVSPRLTLFPEYDGGRFEKGHAVMILSRGLGTHTLPLRIFNPGELVEIHLEPEQTA